MNKSFFGKIVLILTAVILVLSSVPLYASEEYTYESEFAKLPDDIKAMENIRLVDDHDEAVTQKSCGENKSPNHFYGTSYFTGNSGASLTFEFEGTLIGVLVEKGGFDVYLDDEFVGTYWAKALGSSQSQLVYYNDSLANDYHVISVVTNKDAAVQNTGDQYSLFRGFIVQNEVPSGGATKVPAEVPTEGEAAEAPTATDVPDSTAQPTQTPQSTAESQATDEPKATAESKASTDTNDGNNNALLAVLIVLAVLVVAAAVALIIIKKKKK